MVILLLVILHLAALHTVGSNNPDGVEIKKYKDENGDDCCKIPEQTAEKQTLAQERLEIL